MPHKKNKWKEWGAEGKAVDPAVAAAQAAAQEEKRKRKEEKKAQRRAEEEAAQAEVEAEAAAVYVEDSKKETKKRKVFEDEAEEEAEEPKKETKKKKKEAEEEAGEPDVDADANQEDAPKKWKKVEKEEKVEKPLKDRTLYVSGIPWGCEESKLRKDFSECGEIESMNTPLNEQGKLKGISFISFKTAESAQAALKFHGTVYGSRTLSVSLAETRSGKGGDKGNGKGKGGTGGTDFEVWVCGLSFETKESILKKDFAECGPISSMRVLKKPDGMTCRGVAFINFTSMESVEKAVNFNGTEYGGRWITVEKSGDARGANNKTGKDGKGKGGKGKGKTEKKPTSKGIVIESKKTALSEDEDDDE